MILKSLKGRIISSSNSWLSDSGYSFLMTKYSVIDDLIFDSSLAKEYSCAILTVLFKYVANIPKKSKTRIKTNKVSKIVLPFLFSKMNLPPG